MLTLIPKMWARNGTSYQSGPVFFYEVGGLPEIYISNHCDTVHEPVWEIGQGRPTEWAGNFNTPGDALAQLQREIDSAVCPVHQLAMIQTMQWTMQRLILYCPEPGCNARYVLGIGQTTTDQLPSTSEPNKASHVFARTAVNN